MKNIEIEIKVKLDSPSLFLEWLKKSAKQIKTSEQEDMSLKMKPRALAKFLSRGKAEAVARKYKNHIIIAADTFVALKDELLGKPKDENAAEEILNYIKTKEPLDKAGAFAVQGIGAVIVRKIEGDFFGIMGLPLYDLAQTLKKFDVHIL